MNEINIAGVHFGQTAFKLAAENNLDLLCLTYGNERSINDWTHNYLRCCGFMIAGGMHQEALNLLVYFEQRRLFKPALPYLSLPDVDMDSDKYIKWFTQPRNGPNVIRKHIRESPHWGHAYMCLALIKYKRLQVLTIERKKVDAQVMSFLLGTHPRVGAYSPVRYMRGSKLTSHPSKCMSRAITDLFGEKSLERRIKSLIHQVKICSFFTLLRYFRCSSNVYCSYCEAKPFTLSEQE